MLLVLTNYSLIHLVTGGAGIWSLGLFDFKACALVPALEEFTVCHGKMDGYIIKFNGMLESYNRILHSIQCGIEEVMDNSEGLRKSQ